jgi:DNA-binding Lrp family transcriptional regulator
LRADHRRTNREIAALVGVSAVRVGQLRRRLEAEGELEVFRGRRGSGAST